MPLFLMSPYTLFMSNVSHKFLIFLIVDERFFFLCGDILLDNNRLVKKNLAVLGVRDEIVHR